MMTVRTGSGSVSIDLIDATARAAAAAAVTAASAAETAAASAEQAATDATTTANAAQTAAAGALSRANHTGTQAASTITEDATHRFVTDAEKTAWNSPATAVDQTARDAAANAEQYADDAYNLAAQALSTASSHQSANDPHGDRAYSKQRANHTGTQAASTITEDATHRFVTDEQITTWNAPITISATAPENPVLNQLWLQP